MENREELFDICWHKGAEGIVVSNLLMGLEIDMFYSKERTICDPSESTFVKMNTAFYKGFSDIKYCLYYKTADDKFVMVLVNDTEEFNNIKFNVVKGEHRFSDYTIANRYYAFDVSINPVACKLYDAIMRTGEMYNMNMEKNIEYMRRATYYSQFGTCDRLQVGAVVVRDGDMIGTGFNSALAGTSTCNDVGHFMYDNSCKRTIHAEHNAIFAAIEAVGSIRGSVLYCTDRPCSDCMKLIATAGITKVYYVREYSPKYHLELGVELIKLEV